MAKKTTASKITPETSDAQLETNAPQAEMISEPATENVVTAVKEKGATTAKTTTKKVPAKRGPKAKSTTKAKTVKSKPGPKPKTADAPVAEEAAVAATPARRGRKPKAVAEATEAVAAAEPKRRGRKPKAIAADASVAEVPAAEPKRRGRKPKAVAAATETVAPAEPKRRGRKPKAVAAAVEAPKRRGRKPATAVVAESVAEVPAVSAEVSTETPAPVADAPKRRGRPKGSTNAAKTAKKPGRKPKAPAKTPVRAAATTKIAEKAAAAPAQGNEMLTWFEIPALSFERAVNFYNYIFGIQMTTQVVSSFAFAYFPGAMGGAVVAGYGYTPSDRGPLLYLNAGADMDVILARIPAAGGRVLMNKTFINDAVGSIAVFVDTEGNRLALHAKA